MEGIIWLFLALIVALVALGVVLARGSIKNQKIVVLGITDDYDYMDPGLVRLFETLVPRHLATRDCAPHIGGLEAEGFSSAR